MRHWRKVFSMHLFRSILSAHFLRYVTLVIVTCFGIFYFLISTENNIYAATVQATIENTASATFDNGSAISSNAVDTNVSSTIDTTFINILNLVIAAISFLYVPFSMLSGWLLSPDWTFGDFIHLRPVLHSLWIFVSNTVYVVFAAMLIVVAIANIFGQSDSYAIKKMLPRFIIGVIMVPFTWWMVSATLSVSSYMTALVLRMPADMITASNSPQYSVDVPQKCSLDFTTSNTSKVWDCDPPTKKPISEFLKSDNAYGIIPLYAYNIFKFDDLDTFKKALNNTDELSPEQKAEILKADEGSQSMLLQAALIATGLAKVGVQLFMSVLFALVFMIILIALVLVLFTRVIKMWMYAIFSPLFALRYFLSDKIDKDNAIAKFDFKEFIGLAMVPVVVSGALSFGFLFLMTFKTHMEQPITKTGGVSTQQ